MYHKTSLSFILCTILFTVSLAVGAMLNSNKKPHSKKNVNIILGSTRQERTSEKIGAAVQRILQKRDDISIKLVDLRTYNLPLLYDSVAPRLKKEITDPVIQAWADAIRTADSFIIIVPEYNAGYPGVLKNALDLLYQEWNNKPVAFIGYSGGPHGGAQAVAQLRHVARALQMIPVETDLLIPNSWKAFNAQGELQDSNIEKVLLAMIDQLIAH